MKNFDATSFREIISELPKTEIHLHLEGLASVETIWTLMNKYTITVPGVSSKENLKRKFQVRSLDEFVDLFITYIYLVYSGNLVSLGKCHFKAGFLPKFQEIIYVAYA